MKVNFVIAGAQKSGTSALDKYMRENKDILMATKKEVHFFDNETHFDANINYSKYHAHYKSIKQQKVVGDATPIYMYWYAAPRRIWDYNPQMKFIIILRNPIERAYSHWNMQRNCGVDSLSFFEAIKTESQRCREVLPLQQRKFSYIDRGFYTEQLQRIWTFFPKEQTLIIKNQNLKSEPDKVLFAISQFLGIAKFKKMRSKNIHSLPYKTTMTEEEFAYLRDMFFYEIKKLETILGWDCSDWLQ